MKKSIREKLKQALADRGRGEWELDPPTDENDLPYTSLDDGTEAVLNTYDVLELSMEVQVSRARAATSNKTADLHEQAEAILAELVEEYTGDARDPTFGGLASGIEYQGGGTQIQVGKFVWGVAAFTVLYQRAKGDPYAIEPEE